MQLESVFASVLNQPAEALSDETSPNTVSAWDSLRHLELVMAVEAAYGITFETAEVTTIRSLGAMREALRHKGVAA